MSPCSHCDNNARTFSCDRCHKLFCDTCSALTSSEIRCLELKKRTLVFYCKECLGTEGGDQASLLERMLDEKMGEFLRGLSSSFEHFKSDFLALAMDGFSTPVSSSRPSFADVAAGESRQSVVVKPRDSSQKNSQTKLDLVHTIDPVAADVKIDTVKHIRDGGLIVSCKSAGDADKFVQLVDQKLSARYEVRSLKKILPRVRIVGISEKLDNDVLLNCVLKQNDKVFHSSAECKVFNVVCIKNKADMYQATLQLDNLSYHNALESGHLLVGLDVCRVFDAVEVPRCFRCNGFGHTSKACKLKRTCPRCTRDHDLKDCSVSDGELCCVNCRVANERSGAAFDAGHATWNYAVCSAYKQRLSRLKADLFGKQ